MAKKQAGGHLLTVCLVAPVPPPFGGIAHWTDMVTRYAASSRPDVRLEIVDIAPRWRERHDLAVWKRAVGGGIQLLRDGARLLGVLARRRPKVLHITTSGQLAVVRDIVMMLLARAFRTPVVYHIRFGRVAEIARDRTREWRLMSIALRLARIVVPIDSATEQAVRQHVPTARVERIPNCVDPAELPAPAPRFGGGKRTALFLGWVVPTKGVTELMEAWSRTTSEGWRLVVAGPGSPEYRQRLTAQRGAQDVEFPGELSHRDAMHALASADLFVLPSHTEGFPNVILEAMALGRPIVASAVGAIPEMLAGGCGLTVAPRDVEGLAEALARATSEESTRAEMGRRAREKAIAEYSVSSVFERYVRLWRQPELGSTSEP